MGRWPGLYRKTLGAAPAGAACGATRVAIWRLPPASGAGHRAEQGQQAHPRERHRLGCTRWRCRRWLARRRPSEFRGTPQPPGWNARRTTDADRGRAAVTGGRSPSCHRWRPPASLPRRSRVGPTGARAGAASRPHATTRSSSSCSPSPGRCARWRGCARPIRCGSARRWARSGRSATRLRGRPTRCWHRRAPTAPSLQPSPSTCWRRTRPAAGGARPALAASTTGPRRRRARCMRWRSRLC